jgi:hypothetical protein
VEENMRGQTVVCKDFIGDMICLIVWEDSGALIFVHTADQYKAHSEGLPHLDPVGFPVEDVFLWKAESESGNLDRNELEPYCPVTALTE